MNGDGRDEGADQVSDFEAFDLDEVTSRAWSHFQTRLAVHLADMREDDTVILDVESAEGDDAVAPYVQLLLDDGWLHLEASSNEYLTEGHRLGPADETALQEIGFSSPTRSADDTPGPGSANFFHRSEPDDAGRLAVMAVRALRDVFGVPHPAFVHPQPPIDGEREVVVDPVDLTSKTAVVMPRDRAHLLELVQETLAGVYGQPLDTDEDGDFPIVSGSALLFVRVHPTQPVVELLAPLVSRIQDLERAAFEVSVLNRDSTFLKFVLAGDQVMTFLHIPAYPFVPEHLRGLLAMMSQSVDDLDDDVAHRVSGQRAADLVASDDDAAEADDEDLDDDDGGAFHPALLTILQLEADSPGSVSPELAASICDHDRDLILRVIGEIDVDAVAWRRSRDRTLLEGKADDVDIAEHEMRHAERTGRLLRKALRVVAEADLESRRQGRGTRRYQRRRPAAEEPTLFDGDE